MKKFVLIVVLASFATGINAAPTAAAESFDFWAWVESLFSDASKDADAISNPPVEQLANIDTALGLGPR